MYFYISFLFFNVIIMCVFSKNIVIRSGLENPYHYSIGFKFYAVVNNTGDEDFTVEANPDQCCSDANDHKCNIIKILGSATEMIPSGETRTLILVAPLLDPYERKGHCSVHIDCRPVPRPKNVIRETIKIKFDTSLHKKFQPDGTKICEHADEDPLNDCKPVNCEIYYNGKRSFFHPIKQRCLRVPNCLDTVDSDVPRIAYNPVSNKCINNPSICKDDIDFIKALTNGRNRTTKDLLIIKMKSNETAHEPLNNKVTPVAKIKDVPNKTNNQSIINKGFPQVLLQLGRVTKQEKLNCFLKYLASNRFSFVVLTAVVLIQCILICTMVYFLTKKCLCKKKSVVNKFFNYRQDASVTTPLIGTSNMETVTTDFQYLSESSNGIDKKIKCYKACQKERKNNIKLSMSDDILSKCLTRRDWNRMPKSETIPEIKIDEEKKVNDNKVLHFDNQNVPDIKVNFQNEMQDINTKIVKSIVKKVESKKTNEALSDSSEKELRCLSYNCNGNSNNSGFKKSNHSKIFGVFRQENKPASSIEKGAQAYFSNDSIDDFLSERGVLFTGDNPSKYSFSSISSAGKSTLSSPSSKTSKNNVVKNVMSLLSRKKKGPSSDPGANKSKVDLDLELLHLSRASVCSSSNGTDCGKDVKRIRDSTSTL